MTPMCAPRPKTLVRLLSASLLAGALWSGPISPARADAVPFLGQMMWVPYNFAPLGWMFCDGSLLSISNCDALFSLLGTTYGGDGQTTFALPDMRGKLHLHAGQGPALSNYVQGETGGAETVTLTVGNLPAHTHTLPVSATSATDMTPSGKMHAATAGNHYSTAASPTTSLSAATIGNAGGGQPHNNMMPYTTLNCIIAVEGIYPSRN
mgnify:CR=1 FL=1